MKSSPNHRVFVSFCPAEAPEGSIQKKDLSWGDRVRVRTRNSTYLLAAVEDGYFLVSGGWFDRNRQTPIKTRVNGCTWGGTAVLTSVVAAPGLFLEFSDPRVITTRIQSVEVLPAGEH